MTKQAWTDLDRQGRGMAQIVEFCKTMVKKEMAKEKPDYDITLAFLDRQIKAAHSQQSLTDMVLNVKLLMKLAQKKHLEELTNIKLKELP